MGIYRYVSKIDMKYLSKPSLEYSFLKYFLFVLFPDVSILHLLLIYTCVGIYFFFTMDDLINKLIAGGVSPDMIEQLKSGLGDKFESEIISGGLKSAASKLGIDTTNLPEIDYKNAMEAVQELMGKDVDGDGETGISEAIENTQEVIKNTDMTALKEFATQNAGGILAKIKGFIGM
jgi:hypothetical protein